LNLPAGPGVSELLADPNLIDVVQATAVEGLSLLAAGQYTPAAAASLARGGVQEVFGRLRPLFDFIIVDSSPLLAVADTLMIGKSADGVVLSVRAGVSQAPQVYAAYECLQQLGLPFVGTVVSGTRDKQLYAHNSRYATLATSN
jgi:Mrp family chromosome partitioning ATPase